MKYLVYFNNGLVETNVMIQAESLEEAERIFKEDLKKDEVFVAHNCMGKCEYLYTEELKGMSEVLDKIVSIEKLEWDNVEKEIPKRFSLDELKNLRNDVVQRYDMYRNPDVDNGRLPYQAMDNLMIVTTVIDYRINYLGGKL